MRALSVIPNRNVPLQNTTAPTGEVEAAAGMLIVNFKVSYLIVLYKQRFAIKDLKNS
jgi:hypothetical protein